MSNSSQFLYTMLEELNNKFALQLDLTDWSCQNATDTHAENEVTVYRHCYWEQPLNQAD
jgi:hypothetical protein